jgi:hypothetical protein
MRQLIKDIAAKGLKRDDVRAARRTRPAEESEEPGASSSGAMKPFVFKYELPEVNAKLELRFEKSSPSKEEIVSALKVILATLEGD